MIIDKTYLYNKHISRGTNAMKFIIIHHTATNCNQLKGTINVLSGQTTRKVSVHYLVDCDGNIYQFVDDNKIAWHVGTSEIVINGKYYNGGNKYAIGIEVLSDGNNYTNKQRNSVKNLIQYLSEKHNIGIEYITRHKDWTSRKWDIGDNFWKNKYKSFEEYKKSLNIKTKKMTEDDKKRLINNLMNLNSVLYNEVQDLKLKELLAKVNTRFRELGFNNEIEK